MITIPLGITNFLQNVGDQIADPGTQLVLALAIGIPLAFFVIRSLIDLLPGESFGDRHRRASDEYEDMRERTGMFM